MLLVLAVLGWLLLGLLAAVLLLVGLVLFGPVTIRATGHAKAEATEDSFDEEDRLWLALLRESTAAPSPEPGAAGAVDAAGAVGAGDGAAQGGSQGTDLSLDYRLAWLGHGLVLDRAGLRILGWRVPLGKRVRGLPRRRRPPVRRTRRPSRRIRLTRELRRALLGSWAALHFRLRLRVSCGLEDPAATGMLAAWVPAVIAWLTAAAEQTKPGSSKGLDLGFNPVFDRETLMVRFTLEGRTTFAALGWPLVRHYWWPRFRRRLSDRRSREPKEERADAVQGRA